jgi:hypothetical protein
MLFKGTPTRCAACLPLTPALGHMKDMLTLIQRMSTRERIVTILFITFCFGGLGVITWMGYITPRKALFIIGLGFIFICGSIWLMAMAWTEED